MRLPSLLGLRKGKALAATPTPTPTATPTRNEVLGVPFHVFYGALKLLPRPQRRESKLMPHCAPEARLLLTPRAGSALATSAAAFAAAFGAAAAAAAPAATPHTASGRGRPSRGGRGVGIRSHAGYGETCLASCLLSGGLERRFVEFALELCGVVGCDDFLMRPEVTADRRRLWGLRLSVD